jgi:hypothetical protein
MFLRVSSLSASDATHFADLESIACISFAVLIAALFKVMLLFPVLSNSQGMKRAVHRRGTPSML